MKIRKLFFLTLCLFILGGCGLMKNAEEREERHQKVQDEMMAYMENKYGEKFKGDSMEYVLTAEGGYSDYGVVIPDRLPNTYVEVTRKEKDGKVIFSDNYQKYKFGNEFFEYVNKDIRETYPNSFTGADINILDNTSGKLSLVECKKNSEIDIVILIYLLEGENSIEKEKKDTEEFAKKYHEEYNNASIEIGLVWTNIDGIDSMNNIAESYKGKDYYVIDEALNTESSNIKTNGKRYNITVSSQGAFQYKYYGE